MLHKERLEEQRRQMNFLRVVTGNRMTGRKRNKDVAEELEITDISTITETYQMKRLQNVQRKS
jgi:hypothetical protein